jgi:hypothetical protein
MNLEVRALASTSFRVAAKRDRSENGHGVDTVKCLSEFLAAAVHMGDDVSSNRCCTRKSEKEKTSEEGT